MAGSMAACRMREFALNVLSTVRNNHAADSYLRYFPVGYGTAIREHPEQILEVTRVVLGKLGEETDRWLVSLRDRITSTHETLLAAQNRCFDATRGRNDSFASLVAEKRLWIQALAVSRLRAREAYLGDEAYVHAVFAPADAPQRQTAAEPAAGSGSADRPAKAEAPVGVAAQSPAPVLDARVVVTDLRQTHRRLYEKVYGARDDVENRIKELQHGLEIDRTRCSRFVANRFRVLLTAVARGPIGR